MSAKKSLCQLGVEDHLERAEILKGGLHHASASELLARIRPRREAAAVPIQNRGLQQTDRDVSRLRRGDREVFPRPIGQARRVGRKGPPSWGLMGPTMLGDTRPV